MKLHEKIRTNQIDFIGNTLKCVLWSKQKDIVGAIERGNKIAIRSCHGSGKTYGIARIALGYLFAHPFSIVLTSAPTFRQVEQVLWRNIRKAYKMASVPLGGEILKTKYEIDEDWYALGLSADVPENFAGFHSDDILIILDEASGIQDPIFETIDGMLTSSGAKLVLIGNPTKRIGRFADAFTDTDFIKIHISAFDTPNFTENGIKTVEDLTEEKVKECIIKHPGLVTPAWALSMLKKYGAGSDVFRVRVSGEFPEKDSDTLIGLDLVSVAIGSERERYGEDEIIGVDPARYGDDFTAIVIRKGNHARIIAKWSGQDLMKTAGEVARLLREKRNRVAHIDSIGVGAGIVDRLLEQDDIKDRVVGVNSASSPTDKEHYANLRAEMWDVAKEWMVDAILESDDAENDDDWYELAKPRYKILSSGKMLMESKDDMKRRGVPSPNIADALVMTLVKPVKEEEPRIRLL